MIYQHYKGGLYVILVECAFMESNLQRVVVYKSAENGSVWVRDYDEFHGLVELPTDDGRIQFVQRFIQQ